MTFQFVLGQRMLLSLFFVLSIFLSYNLQSSALDALVVDEAVNLWFDGHIVI